ncbi:MAG: hypothetical protein E6K72_09715 [Candidatus Eisenbacteria bacterium]|uniref:Porin family protein n=1 Tax=Eiseniibacteriota bacterium TaxID=2212470 RepID=A0A538SKU6_UNCEI|nr:MAG: hypothetical protein E6K72_09715 [Candidatus Eisenbacteria bacterium]
MNRFLLGLATSAALLLPGRCLGAKVVLPSPGDIGFAGFAQYGTLLNQGEIGEQFGSGPGFGVRLRYRMHTAATSTTLIATGLEMYQMFGTRTRTTRMLSAGVGLAQVTQKLKDNETLSAGPGVGDGFYVSVGGGTETFLWQSWALDLSLRYQAVILNDTTNHDFQITAGLVFYVTD